ncbi:MAG: SCO family protein [Acidobacteriota bacterium]|nr:SCO family protein [Acidobacteriota bacterium]
MTEPAAASADPPGGPGEPSGDAIPWRRVLLWGLLVAALLAVLAVALLPEGGSSTDAELPVLAEVPDFQLINRDGRTVRRGDLLGQPWIADFIFTRCGVSCPVMTARMAQIQEQVPAGTARLVSVSVDPTHDRPPVLQEFAERWGAQDHWLFLTGEADAIYRLMRDGFMLAVKPPTTPEQAASPEPISHSTRLVLVDAQGRIRGYYDGMTAGDEERLLADLDRLAD